MKNFLIKYNVTLKQSQALSMAIIALFAIVLSFLSYTWVDISLTENILQERLTTVLVIFFVSLLSMIVGVICLSGIITVLSIAIAFTAAAAFAYGYGFSNFSSILSVFIIFMLIVYFFKKLKHYYKYYMPKNLR